MRIRVRWGWMVGLLSTLAALLVIAFVLSFSSTGSGSRPRISLLKRRSSPEIVRSRT